MDRDQNQYSSYFPNRGVALIINNVNFHESTHQNQRTGAILDGQNLAKTFAHLQFDVRYHENLTVMQMLQQFRNVKLEDHEKNDCFVCIINSHGDQDLTKERTNEQNIKEDIKDVIYGTDGILYLETLTSYFTERECPSLANKPKIFFIQACRGFGLSESVEVTDGFSPSSPVPTFHYSTLNLPIYKDFLLAYSSPPGFYAFRRKTGSWFITALCSMLEQYHETLDILSILLRVNRTVAIDYESSTRDPETTRRHIVPCYASMLCKDLYWKSKVVFV